MPDKPSCDCFHLLDLASQAQAVQERLTGWSEKEKVAWLAGRGKLSILPPPRLPGVPQGYLFESNVGIRHTFFFKGNTIVFLGDNTAWAAR